LILAGFDHAEIAKSPNFVGILHLLCKKRPIHRRLSDPRPAKTPFFHGGAAAPVAAPLGRIRRTIASA
jgi:hypothetical protein